MANSEDKVDLLKKELKNNNYNFIIKSQEKQIILVQKNSQL